MKQPAAHVLLQVLPTEGIQVLFMGDAICSVEHSDQERDITVEHCREDADMLSNNSCKGNNDIATIDFM